MSNRNHAVIELPVAIVVHIQQLRNVLVLLDLCSSLIAVRSTLMPNTNSLPQPQSKTRALVISQYHACSTPTYNTQLPTVVTLPTQRMNQHSSSNNDADSH
jgi:hypothetical protein